MSEIKRLLERQARWQAARPTLSWPEKVRMVEAVRESVAGLRGTDPRRRPHAARPRTDRT